MSFNVGENIGAYQIIEQLGQGGMATVYKAYHATLDRYVAIKVIHPAFLEDPKFRTRFQREARLVAKLDHSNIVPIYDYSEHEGCLYFVMKLIEGETLKARLSQEPLSVDEIGRVVDAVGSALAYAHTHGVLHRDIKPSNVLLASDGQIYLADFGLARVTQSWESTLSSDMILGTPQYVSPEQAMGKKKLDEGTDIYSFGIMLYELIFGRVPFDSNTPFSIIYDHIYSPLPLPREINPNVTEAMERLLLKALSKDRHDRYQDVASMLEDFHQACGKNLHVEPVQSEIVQQEKPAKIIAPPHKVKAEIMPPIEKDRKAVQHKQIIPDRAILVINLPGQAPREVILERANYRLGREPDNDIVLPVPNVSRYHGGIERQGSNWRYTDLGSRNGTLLEGKRIKQINLRDGLILRIGENLAKAVTLTFRISASAQVKSSNTGLTLLRTYQPTFNQPLTIGRGSDCDIQMPSPLVTRRHAVLRPAPPEWILEDLNSTNGTFINGGRITQPLRLKSNDMVLIGPFRLVVESAGIFKLFVASCGLRLDGLDLNVEVGKGSQRQRILEDVNISCYPQEFIGLVGSSGAGKTTLLKALSGLIVPKGKVLIEGEDLYQNYDAYRTQIGYVPQEDILHKELTVEQALRYSAKLRLPPDIGEDEIKQRIDQVLEQVELSGQRRQPIHSLSGGQRKRASIAVELLADPLLFFLDEPTSGLDPGLEKKMMLTLRKLADGGKTIILATHATANITECDQVVFISQGKIVYYGPPEEAGQFFGVGSNNFADIYTEINDPMPKAANEKAASWEKRFKISAFYQKYIAERIKALPKMRASLVEGRKSRIGISRVSSFRQFQLLTRRYFELIVRDRILLTILLAIMPLLALLLIIIAKPDWLIGETLAKIEQQLNSSLSSGEKSVMYSIAEDSQALIFIMSLASVLLGLFASAYEIVRERTIYLRERMVFLRLLPYIGSKVVLLGGFAAVQCLLFLIVVSLYLKLPSKGVLLPFPVEIYVTMVLGAIAAIMLGLLISSLAPNNNAVTYIVLGVLFLQIIFAGVFFEIPGFAKGLSAMTLSRWTTESMGISADLEYLNSLSRTRIQSEPLTQEISTEVEKPDPDWKPVTIITEMKQIPGCSNPVAMPVVKENEMETITETVTQTVTVEPDPMDVLTPFPFELDYERSSRHLICDWGMLVVLSLVFGAGTLLVIKKKDVIK